MNLQRAETATARLLVTAVLADDPEAYEAVRPSLPSPWQLLDEAAHLAYLTAGAALSLDRCPHSRADIAAAWTAARPLIADALAEQLGAGAADCLPWLDSILDGTSDWWVPACCPEQHLAAVLALTALLWRGRSAEDWRRVCLALAEGEPA